MGMKLVSSWTFSGFCRFCVLLCWIDDLCLKRCLCKKNRGSKDGATHGYAVWPITWKGRWKARRNSGRVLWRRQELQPRQRLAETKRPAWMGKKVNTLGLQQSGYETPI